MLGYDSIREIRRNYHEKIGHLSSTSLLPYSDSHVTGLQKIATQWMQIFYTNAFVAFIMCSVNSQEYMMS